MSSIPVIWLTGLSQSGKTTIADGIAIWLTEHSRPSQILDGSFVRDELGNFFGYSRDERIKVSRVLCVMAKLLTQNGIYPIVTAITPHEESREFNRTELDAYVELYIKCSVDVCVERDTSGQYRRAMRGDLSHFIGVDVAYDIPKRPDLTIDTEDHSRDQCVAIATAFLADKIEADVDRATSSIQPR